MKSTKTKSKTAPLHIGARMDGGDAFIRDPGSGPAHTKDDLAENLAEQFLSAATSAEEVTPDALDQEVPEESGGPFVVTSGSTEFARDTDASNIPGADREPFPSPMRAGKRQT